MWFGKKGAFFSKDVMTMRAANGKENVIYRKMRDSDENQVFDLVKAGFDEYVLADVAEEGEKEFYRAAREMVYNKPTGHFIIIAESKTRIVGMINVRNNNHICLFFVAKEFQRKGIGRGLLERAIEVCIARDSNAREIDVNSSLFAVESYKKLGFSQTKPEQIVNGIRFVPMTKPSNNKYKEGRVCL